MSFDAQVPQSEVVESTAWQDAKLRFHIGNHLVNLSTVFEPHTILVLRACANRGHYAEVFHRLLRLWDVSQHADNADLINLIILSGKAAGCSADEIAEALS